MRIAKRQKEEHSKSDMQQQCGWRKDFLWMPNVFNLDNLI